MSPTYLWTCTCNFSREFLLIATKMWFIFTGTDNPIDFSDAGDLNIITDMQEDDPVSQTYCSLAGDSDGKRFLNILNMFF